MSDVLNKVISFLSGDSEPVSDKDILLRQLAREISQNKYAKFYRLRQGEADASLGQFFFNVYKAVYPLQVFLKDPVKEAKIKQITLEAFLDKQTMDIVKRLSPQGIAERKKSEGEELTKLLQEDLAALAAGFDSPKISAADKCYNLIASMKQFVFFDFSSLLKKFDPEIREGDFLTVPKFTAVDASIMPADIATFLSVLPFSSEDDDWKTVFEIIKYCNNGNDVIPLSQWSSLLASLKDIKQSKIFELMDKLVTGNPILEIKPIVPNETLSAQWLEQKTIEIREVILRIAGSYRNAQIKAMEHAVFGSNSTLRLSYYTPEKGRILLDKGLLGFTYAPALNHLLAFIQDYLSREIHELCDILLVRGQWTDIPASRVMSDGYHVVAGIAGEITKLDETLSDEGTEGSRLRNALFRVDRDKAQSRYINSIVETVNIEALDIINTAVPSMIIVGKHFKMLMDDCEKKSPELIVNWKELSQVSKEHPIGSRISAAYKKINHFVQLMILGTKPLED